MRIIGLDLSLTSAGIARLTTIDGDDPLTWTCTVGASGETDATLAQRWWRLDAQRTRVLSEVGTPDLVVVEGPAMASAHGQQHDRSGLWWLILDDQFTIRFHDGREVRTRNLWYQGPIPPAWRDRLPDNAEFVKKGAVA